MNKLRILIESFRRTFPLCILCLPLLVPSSLSGAILGWSKSKGENKQKVVQQVAQDWIKVGIEQSRRGFYGAAERSFLETMDYRDYLSADERKQLDELLERTHIAAVGRKRILEHIHMANEQVKRNRLVGAEAYLEKIRDDEFLSEEERGKLDAVLEKVRKASFERNRITEDIQRAHELFKQAQLVESEAYLEKVRSNEFLTRQELVQLDELLEKTRAASTERKRILECLQKAGESVKQDELLKTEAHLDKIRGSEFFTEEERERFNELFEKTKTAALERKRVLEGIETAEELVKQGWLTESRSHLANVMGNKFLTAEERELLTEGLKKIDSQLSGAKEQTSGLYNRFLVFYRSGQAGGDNSAAKKGLSPAGKTVSALLGEIDNVLAGRLVPLAIIETRAEKKLPESAVSNEGWLEALAKSAQEGGGQIPPIKQKTKESAAAGFAETEPDEESPAEAAIRKRRNLLRSYTRAVVNDALDKAQDYITKGEFDKAKEVAEAAVLIVKENRVHLGVELFRQYSNELRQLAETIARIENKKARQLQKEKLLESL